MLSISLGPLALPLAPLLLLGSAWLAAWLATRLVARAGGSPDTPFTTTTATADAAKTLQARAALAGNTIFQATWIGLAGARLAFVAQAADLYLADPLTLLDLRDGGWHAPSGWLAGIAWLAWRAQRRPDLRRALLLGGAGGVLLWLVSSTALGTRAGPPLPALAVSALADGRSADLAGLGAGRPTVVNLWASWCGPCRQEMPLLAAAQQRDRGIRFLFVNQGETAASIQAYLTDQALPLQEVWLDAGSRLGPAVGSRGLPTTLFYDAQGRLVERHFGVLNAVALETRLRRLRAAAP